MNPASRRLPRPVHVVLALLVVAVTWLACRTLRSGIAVDVTNDEAFALRNVEVRTTAGRYPLGDLAPGESASVRVGASGESSVSVAWTPQGGSERTADADVYFEGSPHDTGMYGGWVKFVVRDGGAESESSVGPGTPWFAFRGRPDAPREVPRRRRLRRSVRTDRRVRRRGSRSRRGSMGCRPMAAAPVPPPSLARPDLR